MFIDLKMDGRQIFTDENNNTFHLDSLEERMRLLKETLIFLELTQEVIGQLVSNVTKTLFHFFKNNFFHKNLLSSIDSYLH